jgi:myo-inositol-1(or 4)-monophosphatase
VTEPKDDLEVALEAARAGGAVLLQHFGKLEKIEHKGKIDLLTQADLESERTIVEILRNRFPDDQILAEEGSGGPSSGSKASQIGPDRVWIVDPLDGTTNYAHGYPVFAVAIGLEVAGELEVGVVFDPIRDECFAGKRLEPATLNGKIIKPSKTASLIDSLLCTGFPYDVHDSGGNLDHFSDFVRVAQDVRRVGSAALDICYVACGRLDGFWEFGLKAWDLAGPGLIAKCAGAKVTSFSGGPFDWHSGEVVASNGLIHDEMIEVLARAPGHLP